MAAFKSVIATPASSGALAASAAPLLSCNWTSAAQVVGEILADKLNVTDVVAQCPNVCQVTFNSSSAAGSLAGEGVMISYFLQVALVSIFGALFPIFIWLVNHFPWKTAIRRTPLLRKLQKSVYETNAFFSISLLVASIVRWRQVPSVIETVSINYVVWVQLLIISLMLFAQLADHAMNSSHLGWDWQIYYIAIGIAQLAASCVLEVPNRNVYKSLATQCHDKYDFVDLSSYLPASEKGKSSLQWYIIGAFGGLVLGILSGAFEKVLLKIIPKWLRKHGETAFFVFFLLLNLLSVIANTVVAEHVRDVLKKLSGEELPDNGWTYGQTTAILLWLPFLWTAVKETIKHLRERRSDEQNADEMVVLGLERAPLAGVEPVPPPYTPRKDIPLDADLPQTF